MPEPILPAAKHSRPEISVIVPVWNGATVLPRSLGAIAGSRGVTFELIVADDGSTDASADIARSFGARVVRTPRARSGPGIGRNVGAAVADAALVVFVDADVVVQPDTLAKLAALFREEPVLAAAFGSYDEDPDSPAVLSQYRNLLHHYTHQVGNPEASTFWAGCGAIRREIFLAMGGFDVAYTRPSIEDIELGYRLRAAGYRIRLARDIHAKHLKRWTLRNILETDIRDRALPWTRLIAQTGTLPNDLNLDSSSRYSAISVFALAGLALVGLVQPLAWLAALVPVAVLLRCNRGLYGFLLRRRGPLFLLRVLPMHWLYFAYSSVVFALGMAFSPRGERRRPGLAPGA